MSEMNPAQRARWKSRMRKAQDALDSLRCFLESTFEVCAERRAFGAAESKQEECEALAAQCVRDAIGCVEGLQATMGAAWTHLEWERNRETRNAQHKFTQEWMAARQKPTARPAEDPPGEDDRQDAERSGR